MQSLLWPYGRYAILWLGTFKNIFVDYIVNSTFHTCTVQCTLYNVNTKVKNKKIKYSHIIVKKSRLKRTPTQEFLILDASLINFSIMQCNLIRKAQFVFLFSLKNL